MSMNNLNEQINKRVVFDNDDYGVYLPYNLESICTLVPKWCESKKIKERTLESFKQAGVLYIVNNKKDKSWYVLKDEGSRIPLQKSGKYRMYTISSEGFMYGNENNAKKYFSQSKELRDILNLNYTVNEMLKYGMPFTPEEMKVYSEETPFAKVIYEIIMKKRGKFALEKFTGRDDIEIIEDALSPYEDIDNGSVAIHPRHDGVTIYMEDEYFKEKVLNLTQDDEWVYNSADFLEKYFPKEAESMEQDWLHSLGCAISRGRAKGVREYIEGEILFEFEEHGNMSEMFIPWSSLLRIVGKNELENFEGIVDSEINDVGHLYDMWNSDFKNMLEKINDDQLDNVKGFANIRGNTEKFETQVIAQFDFIPENNYRNSSAPSYKLRNPIPLAGGKASDTGHKDTKIYIKDWSPDTGEIMFYSTDYGHHSKQNQQTMHIDEFIKFLHNLKNNPEIPFPEEEKEVNEHHTQRIIDNIINRVIQENTQVKQK